MEEMRCAWYVFIYHNAYTGDKTHLFETLCIEKNKSMTFEKTEQHKQPNRPSPTLCPTTPYQNLPKHQPPSPRYHKKPKN
jgi:hypothetical protein